MNPRTELADRDAPLRPGAPVPVLEIDQTRIRASDLCRYWPSAKIALGLMLDSASGGLASTLHALIALGDAMSSVDGRPR